jgi:hypothetical protein
MEIGKPTTVDVKESANEGQIGGQHYKTPCDTALGLYTCKTTLATCEGSVYKVHLKVEE